MKTIISLRNEDNDIIALEDDDGELFLSCQSDPDSDTTPIFLRVTVEDLERLAQMARNQTLIHARAQRVFRMRRAVRPQMGAA